MLSSSEVSYENDVPTQVSLKDDVLVTDRPSNNAVLAREKK
jgi:hypothetical protein